MSGEFYDFCVIMAVGCFVGSLVCIVWGGIEWWLGNEE